MEQYPIFTEEHSIHGSAVFPCAVYQASPVYAEKIYCHWHHELEFLFISEGSASLHIGNQAYNVSSGDIAFIPSNAVHMVLGEPDTAFSFTAIVFHPDFVRSFGNDTIQEKYLTPLFNWQFDCPSILNSSASCRELMLETVSLYQEKSDGYELSVKINLLRICSALYQYAKPFRLRSQASNDSRAALAKEMMLYLQEHYDEAVTLPEMAEHFHISRGHLCRFFKEMTNMPPIDYLNYFRINKSALLLRNTDLSVSAVAGQTGFNNISYYNRTFRRYMHMTPGEYRRSIE